MFTAFTQLCLARPLIFTDLETTGLDVWNDRVIEIALLKVLPDSATRHEVLLVDPGRPIPPTATAVHGIRDADVSGCPPFGAVAPYLLDWLAGCDLAGFNIRRFDLPLLVAEFARAGITFPLEGRAVLDVQQIFHRRERRDLTAALRFYCGQERDRAHQAHADALACAAILDAQLARYPDLPCTVPELHAALTEVDLAGHFRRDGDQIVFAFGKYLGRSLEEIAREDPGYLLWMLEQGFLDDVKQLVARHLAEHCPE